MVLSVKIMPFGKHKGTPISEVPHDYLHWLRDNANLQGWLADAVESELAEDDWAILEAEDDAKPAKKVGAPELEHVTALMMDRYIGDEAALAVIHDFYRELTELPF